MLRFLVPLLVFLFSATDALSDDVRVTVERKGPCAPEAAVLVATPASSKQEPIRVQLKKLDDSVSLQLSEKETWSLALEDAGGCWSDRRTWSRGDSRAIAIRVFPRGTIRGTFEAPQALKPGDARASIVIARPDPDLSFEQDGSPLDCELDAAKWSCAVPAGAAFDLRWDVAGYAAVYEWGVFVETDKAKELPAETLRPGASLTGWVQAIDGSPAKNARLTLYPLEAELRRGSTVKLRRATAQSNARGFFQFAGLAAGTYRLVSELEGASPVSVPEVTVREGEHLEWPRNVRHLPFARLTLLLEPHTDSDGKPWIVELSEIAPLHLEQKPPLSRPAGEDGRWSADHLRAETYRVYVRNAAGSYLERATVALDEGVDVVKPLTITRLLVRGKLTYGGEPLKAAISFNNETGKSAYAISGEDGTFEAAFPMTGPWTPTIRYPDEDGPRIIAKPVEIPDPAKSGGTPEIEIALSGARIRGKAVTATGQTDLAVVHIDMNDGRIAADQVTAKDGKYDLLGIAPGHYSIAAEGKLGATPAPLDLQVGKDDDTELDLVLEPYRRVSATIRNQAGLPVSGAKVRISVNGGRLWDSRVTDVAGGFMYNAPGHTGEVWLIVLSFAYPTAMLRFPSPPDGEVITLQPNGGIIRTHGAQFPIVWGGGISAPVNTLVFPEPFGRFNHGVFLPPGEYRICPSRNGDGTCHEIVLTPGQEISVDFNESGERKAP